MLTRRTLLGSSLAALAAPARDAPIIDTHIHLFAPDRQRFPLHPNAVYVPEDSPLEPYLAFAKAAGVSRVVIVHPEPYQDDHRYLEHCFANEPSPLFFKGTCLFDPIDPATPARMRQLMERNPNRIVALRIHCTRERGAPPTTSGSIRDRDLTDARVRETVRAAGALGLAIQFHMIPVHAPQVRSLAERFVETPFLIDHLARSGFGTPAEFAQVLEMAALPNVHMKFSAVRYSSREDYPHADVRALVRQVYDAFGPYRIIWGGVGKDLAEFQRQRELLDEYFQFATEADRARIRGGNAMRLFWGA